MRSRTPRLTLIVLLVALLVVALTGCGAVKPEGSTVTADDARGQAALYIEQRKGLSEVAGAWLKNPAVKVSVQWGTIPEVYDGETYNPPLGKAWVITYENPEGPDADPKGVKVIVDARGIVRNAYSMHVIKRGDAGQ